MPLDLLAPLALSGRPTEDLPERFARRPHLLASALAAAKAAAPDLARLADHLLPRLPRCPLASDNLHTGAASSSPALLDDAVGQAWISLNAADWTNAVGTDCDHDRSGDLVEALMPYLLEEDPDAPRPMIVQDWWTGRAHVTWVLARPVYTGAQGDSTAAASAPVLRTLAAVQRGLCAALEGDPGFTNRLTKNPFARGACPPGRGQPARPLLWDWYVDTACPARFRTLPGDCRPVGLLTLWRALKRWRDDTGQAIPRPPCRRARPGPDDFEKGTRLFNAARFPVYDLGTSDLHVIRGIVDEQAAALGSPAPDKQRGAIAASIARFMRTKWTGRAPGPTGRRRGAMALDAASLDLAERQALGGRYAGRANKGDTDRRIAAAVVSLKASGRPLTQAAIAAAAGVSERTVRRRWTAPAPIPEPDKQCLSGSGRSRPPRPSASSSESSESLPSASSPSLAESASRDRALHRTVAALDASARSAARPGAVPAAVPDVPSGVAADRAVRDARHAAERAQADARRRTGDRKARADADARKADYRARLEADPAAAWAWWRGEIRRLDEEWDAREAGTEAPHELAAVKARREAVIGGRWRSWKLEASRPRAR